MADALLSLKHAVVHPAQMNHVQQFSPLSPGLTSSLPPHGFSYTMSPQPPMPAYTGSSQYTPQYPDTPPPQGSPTHGQSQGMFPSMSVNVSMSMNVGMPGMGNQGATNPHCRPVDGSPLSIAWSFPAVSQFTEPAHAGAVSAVPPDPGLPS